MKEKYKRMKKRIWSILLTICMCVTLMPSAGSLAASSNLLEDSSKIGSLEAGVPKYGNGWSWDGDETLKLYGADLKAGDGETIITTSLMGLNIEVQNYNRITVDGNGSFIDFERTRTVISGSGILDINLKDEKSKFIKTENSQVEYKGGYIHVSGNGYLFADEMTAEDGTVSNGFAEFYMQGGYIDAPDAKFECRSVYMQGGYMNVADMSEPQCNVITNVTGGYLKTGYVKGEVKYKNSVVELGNTDENISDAHLKLVENNAVLILPNVSGTDSLGWLSSSVHSGIKKTATEVIKSETMPATVICNELVTGSAITTDKQGVYAVSDSKVTMNSDVTLSGGNYFGESGDGNSDLITLDVRKGTIATEAAVVGNISSAFGYALNVSGNSTVIGEGAELIGISSGEYGTGVRCKDISSQNIIGIGSNYGVVLVNCRQSGDAGIIGVNTGGEYGSEYAVYDETADGDVVYKSSVTAYALGKAAGFYYFYDNKCIIEGDFSAYSEQNNAVMSEGTIILGDVAQLGAVTGDADTSRGAIYNKRYQRSVKVNTGNRIIYRADAPGAQMTLGEEVEKWTALYYIGDEVVPIFASDSEDAVALGYVENSTASADYMASSAIADEEDVLVEITNSEGNAADSLFGIKKKVDGRKVTVELTQKQRSTPGTVYNLSVTCHGLKVVRTLRICGQMSVLDFTLGQNNTSEQKMWEHEGYSFMGCNFTSAGQGWQWNPASVTSHGAPELVLDGFSLYSEAAEAIVVPGGTHIKLRGQNNISCRRRAVWSDGNLVIETAPEGGSLGLESREAKFNDSGSNYVLYARGDITIQNSIVTVTGGAISYSASQAPPIGGGEDNVTLQEHMAVGIKCFGGLTLSDSQVSVSMNPNGLNTAIESVGFVLKGTNRLSLTAPSTLLAVEEWHSAQISSLSNLKDYSASGLQQSITANPAGSGADGWKLYAENTVRPVVLETKGITQTKAVSTEGTLKPGTQIDISLADYFEGGSGKYVFSTKQKLPEGVTLDAVNGKITGTVADKNIDKTDYTLYVNDADEYLAADDAAPFTFTFGPAKRVHTITVQNNEGGMVEYIGDKEVWDGDSVQLKVTPKYGYRIKTLRLDEKDVTLTDGMYIIENIVDNHVFAVEFEKIPEYKVSVTNPQNSHIDCSTAEGNGAQEQTVFEGSEIHSIVYTAQDGYYFPENYVNQIAGLTDGRLNGIQVTRNSDTQITLEGAPVTDVAITLAAAETAPVRVSEGPVQSEAPVPSGSPVQSEAPAPSGSPVQSDSPIPSGSPVQSEKPIPSGNPIPSGAPVQSQEPTPSPLPEGTPGDVNRDGYINLIDAQLTLKAALKIQPFKEEEEPLADVNGDGTVNLLDAQLILKRALKIINTF